MISSMKKIPAKVYLASDHAGFVLKDSLLSELKKLKISVLDLGCDSESASVDYPDYANKLCKKVRKNSADFGILICGSGVGISIAANRHKHIRAALCHSVKAAKLSRAHNNANVLCLGARMVKNKTALSVVKAFLTAEFEGGRHERRVAKLSK
jgi:ribose 5-phosphate isomerase B